MSNTNRKSITIIFIAWLAYLVSYMGRSDYAACLIEIIHETGVSRSAAGMVSSAFAICNALGQLLSTVILKRISPVKVIGVELFSVAAINLLFPIANSFVVMAFLWGINGFMQSTLLCGITMIFTQTLREPYLSKGAVLLNTIGAAGGMFNYALSWAIIRFFDWNFVFITVATLLFTLAILWCIIIPNLTGMKHPLQHSEKKVSQRQRFQITRLLKSHAVFAVIGGMFVGLLRESVSLWIPTYMNDTLNVNKDLSIIITAFVPCLQIFGAFFGGHIGRKQENIFLLSCQAFAISGLCFIIIGFLGDISVMIDLIMFIVNAICMTAALTFLLSLYPIRYFEKENVVVLVGVINFFVHLGDFISSTGIGWLSQSGGWNFTFFILGVGAFLSAGVCMLGSCTIKRRGV